MTFKSFMELMGGVGGVFYGVLTIMLVVSYYYLNKALGKRFDTQEMKVLSTAINYLFFVLVLSFALRTGFLLGEGHYEGLV